MPYIDKINVGGTDYDIGGGGHVIEDASGTELTQRDTLQIAGTLKATDDSTNEKTVISDAAEEVEWSVWNAMTEAQRDEYSAGKKLDIVNVPGADGTISADLMTLLWTNPSPSAAFDAQTIQLDLSDYDFVQIFYRFRTTSDGSYTAHLVQKNGNTATNSFASNDSSAAAGTYCWSRNATATDEGIVFSGCYHGYTGRAVTVSNNNIIPTKIYGIKKTINLKINAIASDVSTSASKCMMSDGRSVEDTLTEKIEVTANNGETFSSLLNRLYALIDFDKLSVRSVLMNSGGHIARLQLRSSVQCIFSNGYTSSTGTWNYGITFILRQTGSSYFALTNSGATDYSTTAATGTTLTLYY